MLGPRVCQGPPSPSDFLHVHWDPGSGQDTSSFPWSFWQIKGVLDDCSRVLEHPLIFKELGLSPAPGLSLHLPISVYLSLWHNQNSVAGVSMFM